MTILNNPENLSASFSYLDKIKLQIEDLQKLGAGWDFGDGEPISDEVGVASIEIAEMGLTLGLKAGVRPLTEGGIVVTLFYSDHFLLVTVKPDGYFDVTYEKGIGVNYDILDDKENLNSIAVRKYIIQWVSSERYTFLNTIKTRNVLPVTHLKNIKDGGISVFDEQCAKEASNSSLCTHIEVFYNTTVGNPICYCKLDLTVLKNANGFENLEIVNEKSNNGDICHKNLRNFTNGAAEKFFKSNFNPPNILMCCSNVEIQLTVEQYEDLPNNICKG